MAKNTTRYTIGVELKLLDGHTTYLYKAKELPSMYAVNIDEAMIFTTQEDAEKELQDEEVIFIVSYSIKKL